MSVPSPFLLILFIYFILSLILSPSLLSWSITGEQATRNLDLKICFYSILSYEFAFNSNFIFCSRDSCSMYRPKTVSST